MDKWFANMVAGAVLSALLVLFGANTFINILYPTGGSPEAPPAQEAGTATADAGGQAQQEAEPEPQVSFASLMSTAEASAGEGGFRKCAACHSIEEGGQNKIGPALYGVVGREVASVDGFSYSSALQEYGGEWTYERLDCFLENPSECVPGNKMSFAGVKDNEDRADIIAYLRAQTPDAPPLPEPTEAASESGDAAAGDAETTDAAAASEGGADASAGDGSGEAASTDAASETDTSSEEAAADEAASEEAASEEATSEQAGTDGAAASAEGGEASGSGDQAASGGEAEASASDSGAGAASASDSEATAEDAAQSGESAASASDGQADEEADASSAPAEGDQAASASVEEPATQN